MNPQQNSQQNQQTPRHSAPENESTEVQPDLERLKLDGREPIEEEHPAAPFSVVAISYLVVLFVGLISATAIIAVYNALT